MTREDIAKNNAASGGAATDKNGGDKQVDKMSDIDNNDYPLNDFYHDTREHIRHED